MRFVAVAVATRLLNGEHDAAAEFNGKLVISSIYTFHKYLDTKLTIAYASIYLYVSQCM